MIVNSQNPEFTYELISTIPYAYWLHKQGSLTGTLSAYGSEALYYFSPDHEINPLPRSWYNVAKMTTPNKDIHKRKLDTRQFEPPPYKEIYANDIYDFDIVVYNRYNNEWPGVPELNRPINYFTPQHLDRIFNRHQGAKICYIDVYGFSALDDNAPAMMTPGPDVNYDPHMHVTGIWQLCDNAKDFNRIQMQVMANAKVFYTLNGGGSILASYFGGVNYIHYKPTFVKGRNRWYPKEHETGDFGYYHLFGGSEISVKHLI